MPIVTRRRFVEIALLPFAGAIPAARAQTARTLARIGVLAGEQDTTFQGTFAATLRELGWTADKNVVIDWRKVTRDEEIAAHASDLVRRQPQVIVTAGPRITQAVAKLTAEIPIVFLAIGDPEKLGLVRSLARPGGNVTGFRTVAGEGYPGKLLELLKEVAPGISRVGLMIAGGNATHDLFVKAANKIAPQLSLALSVHVLKQAGDIEPAFESAKRAGAEALIFPGDLLFATNRERIAALAIRQRLPTMFMFPYYIEAGGLLAYGVSVDGLYRDVARAADKILRGARPQEIPVEQPTKFDLIVNLKTARALSIRIPQSILLRADQIIE